MLGPNQKGDIAEAEVAASAIKAGCVVSRPLNDHPPYDLVVEVAGKAIRVQCKWAPLRDGVIQVRLRRCSFSPGGGYRRAGYTHHEIDAVGVYCHELDRSYLVPIDVLKGREWLSLRVAPARNGQRAALHWATNFLLPGAVAQLEERVAGSDEVGGSSPPSSIPAESSALTVSSQEFRNRFGEFMELAASGTSITVTRHGRSFARLTTAEPAAATPRARRRARSRSLPESGPSGAAGSAA